MAGIANLIDKALFERLYFTILEFEFHLILKSINIFQNADNVTEMFIYAIAHSLGFSIFYG
jgi:hypothetical protein